MGSKFLTIFLLLGCVLLPMQSCVRKPFACFKTDVHEDSMFVSIPVTFSALCSSNTEEYFWKFYDNNDSIEFDPTVTKIFNDTGSVKVVLSVVNGNKVASETRYYQIKP